MIKIRRKSILYGIANLATAAIKIIAAIFICLSGYSCGNQHHNSIDSAENQYITEILKFDLDESEVKKHSMLKNLDSIIVKEVIKLGRDPDLPVGHIDKIAVAENRIFVLDRTYSKFLFVYDRQGNFLYKIGEKGNGPGEYYSSPKDFHIDESHKTLTVFNSEMKTLFTYNWDGRLIETRVLKKTWPYAFAKSDSMFYFAYNIVQDSDSHLFRIEDKKENTYFKYKKLKNKRDVLLPDCLYSTHQHVYFVEDYNNDIIVLKGREIEKIISIDFGKNAIAKNFLTEDKGEKFIEKAIANKKATQIRKIVETEQLFTFGYIYEDYGWQVIYNKKNGNYLNGISLNTGCFPSKVENSYNNCLVSALSAEYFDSILSLKDENPEEWWNTLLSSAHPVMKEIFQNLKEDDTYDYVFIYELHI
ncbi:MAG: 6-bladed beta-propeller [Prevotellaceae bacterium]|jgi:hypothetical protein|nr:6-bladed beta-propeller [Prevotellaceae bacterium]